MIKKFTRLLFPVFSILSFQLLHAQTTITQWDFNSNPPDASTSTGSVLPSAGSGTIIAIGGVTSSFASGASNGGSSDPAATDNSGLGLTNFPAQGTGDKTAGVEIAVSTSGYQGIQVTFDLRHSNTASKYLQFQYTTDISAVTPVWVDFAVDFANSGDVWNPRSYDLSAITALNNNPNAAFRIVSTFVPATTAYAASSSSSSYGTGGTWRFDMMTVKGTSTSSGDVIPPVAQSYKTVSSTTSYVRFSEPLSAATATNIANYTFSPSLSVSSATLGVNGDTVFLTHAPIADGQAYTLDVSGVQDIALNTMATVSFNVLFNGSLPNLVITEFAHSPNTMEMIEVYNAGATTANLNGLKWTDGTTGNFPNATLAPGATILFSTNITSAATLLGGTYYLINNGLGSSNDQLVIRNSLEQVIDSVDYFVGANAWPSAPSSVYGYSFELTDASLDNNNGANWTVPQNIISSANGTILATPGVFPPPAPNPAPQVLSFKQVSATATYVVFNQAVTSASASNTANFSFSPSLAVTAALAGTAGDTVFLTHAPLADGVAYTLTVSGVVNSSNVPNTTADLSLIWNASVPALVITEIIHSPNDIEMIEIYNAGAASVNLGGLKWTDGTTGSFPVTSLAAGATAVFATSPTTASSILGIPTVYTINNGLGSSNDVLVIRNSLEQVIDSVDYYVGTNGWPVAPASVYGYSFELTDANLDNNTGNNWIVPLNTVTPQPSQGVVRATPGVYPAPVIVPPTASVSFVGSRVSVNENATEVKIAANLTGGGANPSSIDIELIAFGTATSGGDFTMPVSLQYNWPASANNVNDTITIAINDDALPENAEYFIVRFTNPVNISLPAASVNHFTVFILDDDKLAPAASQQISLNYLASIGNGVPGPNSAEIVAHDPGSQKLFIANSLGAKIDIVDFTNPAAPSLLSSVSVAPYGNINSIAVHNGIVAAAIENAVPENLGKVVFFDANGNYLNQVNVGAMPDMITFDHTGTRVLTANEGQPNSAYTVDPEGSVSIIDISGGIAGLTQTNVTTAGFTSFNAQAATLKAAGVRIFGPGATVAQDMEPEYITVSDNDQTAWVTCQENNAIAIIDIATATVTQILPLGTKDHMLAANALDINDQGGVVQIANWPVKGVYMPDAIASYTVGGQTYLVTANEGDAREYGGLDEASRVSAGAYVLDPVVFPFADALKANIGRLNVTTMSGDLDNDGDFDEIHAYGGRSVSIWNATTGALVWDSGDELEMIISKHPVFGAIFNASNANNNFKNRSDDKGPEPEGVVVATIGSEVYAFIALERIGGCVVYNITNPAAPVFTDYQNSRTVASYGGDNGAEGIVYIAPANSPNGQPMVILANEVSSTLSIYQVNTTPLNISLADINAVNAGKRNRVNWTTVDEAEGDMFELERSNDGVGFRKIASINGKAAGSYSFWDEHPSEGMNYYRLKLVSRSGEYDYSRTVTAYVNSEDRLTVKAFPNPVKDQLTISVSGHQGDNASVEITDITGTVVGRQVMTGGRIIVDFNALSEGIYMVRYTDDIQTKVVKVRK